MPLKPGQDCRLDSPRCDAVCTLPGHQEEGMCVLSGVSLKSLSLLPWNQILLPPELGVMVLQLEDQEGFSY